MYEQIQYLLNKIGSCPENPRKPVLYSSYDSKRISAHADAFAEYEVKFAEFEAERISYYKRKEEIEHEVQAIIKYESGLGSIPDQYRDKVWRLAKSRSDDYYDCYLFLCELVEIFE